MFYIITGLPLAMIFSGLQFFLCEKTEKNIIRILPVSASAAMLLLAAFIRGQNLFADAIYGIFGQGIFALIVLLWILGGAIGIGVVIGWLIYIIKHK